MKSIFQIKTVLKSSYCINLFLYSFALYLNIYYYIPRVIWISAVSNSPCPKTTMHFLDVFKYLIFLNHPIEIWSLNFILPRKVKNFLITLWSVIHAGFVWWMLIFKISLALQRRRQIFIWSMYSRSEAYSIPCQTSEIELFAKIFNGFKPLTVNANSTILDIWQRSEYACAV